MTCRINLGLLYSPPSCLAVTLPYNRDIFQIAIPLLDFFLGAKSEIAGHFGTFLPDIGGFFPNHLPGQFGSNLFIFCMFFWSI